MRRKPKKPSEIPAGLLAHFRTQEKIAAIETTPVEVGNVIYATLDAERYECITFYEIVRVLRIDGDMLTVVRANGDENSGHSRKPVTIPRSNVAK